MNLNPFELRKNDYDAKELYRKDKYSSKGIEQSMLEVFKERSAAELWLEMGYSYLLMAINMDIKWRIACLAGEYQGDVFYVGNDEEGRFYFYHTGYGSCSGCDMYMAVEEGGEETWQERIDEMQELQDEIKRSIRQFEDVWEFLRWFLDEDSKSKDCALFWDEKYDLVDMIADVYKLPLEKKIVLRDRERRKSNSYRGEFSCFGYEDGDGGYFWSEMFRTRYWLDEKKLIVETWPCADYGDGSYGYGYLLHGSEFGTWKLERVLKSGNALVYQEYKGKIRYMELECDENHTWDAFQNENRLGIRRIARRIAKQYERG